MNRTPDVELVLREWLADGGDVAPDRILDVVAERIASQPRRTAWRLPWRERAMNRLAIYAAVAAAVVLAVSAWQFLSTRENAVGGPSRPPLPSPTPAASPQVLAAGPLAPGTWVSRFADIQISLEVPAEAQGWEGGGLNFLGVQPMTEPPDGVFLGFNVVTLVPADPCRDHLTAEPIGNAVEDLSAFWSALPHAEIAGPTEIVVGGFEGVRFQLTIDEDLSECGVEAISLYYAGTNVRVVGAGQRVELWAIDVDGTRLVVEASSFPGADPEDVRVLGEILGSIQLDTAG